MYAFARRLLLVLATVSLAVYALEPRLASSCSSFTGPGVFDTASNFTLAAVPVDPANGAPKPLLVNNVATALKISWLILSAIGGTSPYPILDLQAGYLRPINVQVPQQMSYSLAVPDGSSPSFTLEQFMPTNAAPVYCGVPNPDLTSPPLLALNGRTDLFSICSNHTIVGLRPDLVYDAPAGICGTCMTDCCYQDCFDVNVQIIFN